MGCLFWSSRCGMVRVLGRRVLLLLTFIIPQWCRTLISSPCFGVVLLYGWWRGTCPLGRCRSRRLLSRCRARGRRVVARRLVRLLQIPSYRNVCRNPQLLVLSWRILLLTFRLGSGWVGITWRLTSFGWWRRVPPILFWWRCSLCLVVSCNLVLALWW